MSRLLCKDISNAFKGCGRGNVVVNVTETGFSYFRVLDPIHFESAPGQSQDKFENVVILGVKTKIAFTVYFE
jgi:hypothetical protein